MIKTATRHPAADTGAAARDLTVSDGEFRRRLDRAADRAHQVIAQRHEEAVAALARRFPRGAAGGRAAPHRG
ncbi:hypothetical protein [Amycolatopsis sp. YIM 10]|uniref:hypothetical protein n=1 Tax=Amycolatopsis sp. YIM 10 TaxID=2653857 RepID=UPI001290441A|nr:hypothetical protein [Amycolatopsis sp. YIM 10]QFU91135.1 hypothetical protein YIM_29845 [Amycolatopsis sp. YIM 10]